MYGRVLKYLMELFFFWKLWKLIFDIEIYCLLMMFNYYVFLNKWGILICELYGFNYGVCVGLNFLCYIFFKKFFRWI